VGGVEAIGKGGILILFPGPAALREGWIGAGFVPFVGYTSVDPLLFMFFRDIYD
jgi:hypothetical protein